MQCELNKYVSKLEISDYFFFFLFRCLQLRKVILCSAGSPIYKQCKSLKKKKKLKNQGNHFGNTTSVEPIEFTTASNGKTN